MKQIDITKVLRTLMAVAVLLVAMILLSPCLLVFTEGADGGITVWNFVGIAYLLGVIAVVWYMNKRYQDHDDREETEG